MTDKKFDTIESGDFSRDRVSLALWLFVFLVPVLTIINAFILQKWGWGIMDDLQTLTSGKWIIDRAINYFKDLVSFGVFRPTYTIHAALFYTIFDNRPDLLYIVKALEICIVLILWGFWAYRITRKRVAVILVPAITLSFHYFYDTFFYLSSQEIIGLLFLAIAAHLFLSNLSPVLDGFSEKAIVTKIDMKKYFLAILFLIISFGAKETFTSCGIAFGLIYICLNLRLRKAGNFKLSFLGLGLIAVTLAYDFLLLKFVKGNYSSRYAINDLSAILVNINLWARKCLINHVPWLITACTIFFLFRKSSSKKDYSFRSSFGIWTAVSLYAIFLFILLPWYAAHHYAGPLGLFFALAIAILVADLIPALSLNCQIAVIIPALFFNQFVCQYALQRESNYQYDTYNLIYWFRDNPLFSQGKYDNFNFYCSVPEPAYSIPVLLNRKYGVKIKKIFYSLNPDEEVEGKKCDFYLFSPRFAAAKSANLKNWSIVFLSKNWIVYKRVAIP